jgi:multisubunit Na+/H+ antiporter MnhB subunit
MNKFFKQLFDFDANTNLLSKIVTFAVVVPLYLVAFYVLLSSFGLFDNDVSRFAHYATTQRPAAHLWGFIWLAVCTFGLWAHYSNYFLKFEIAPGAISAVILFAFGIAIMINCNFRFDMNHIIAR